ncbi:hypothetical protein [Streptomyces sp. NPDC057682]|uniref:hypothetical protein n=1 Tax=Streptomyces sp. NPDC057682 TaxID=3346210 RepID=UPI0036C704A6
MRRIQKFAQLTAGAALIAGTLVAGAPSAQAASCSGGSSGMYCGNYAPTGLLNHPCVESGPECGNIKVVDTLRTSYSWFKCYVRGEQHSGGNNIWYYTNGDDYGNYGYIAAARVFTSVDPAPGLPRC